ncbi:LeuD/DmdB family oxidoreductase small subunit [Candidatus Lokiarchaeum ossiferum]|uniref:LeuD/DmdB family oxidoreductase small subunit n=1 Tax=Candidatus Lokiarchaeum ossiferum TaxID=2951803 RepID=UPI00352E93F0
MKQSNKLILSGKIWKLGDSIDTDLIVPSRVLTEQDSQKLLSATLELVFPDFVKDVQSGDIIVAGRNFGCGSSREEAVFVLKELGISCLIAESFARIFYRNSINLGLPPISFANSHELGNHGDILEIDLNDGKITNITQEKSWNFSAFPEFLREMLDQGGAFGKLQNNGKNR